MIKRRVTCTHLQARASHPEAARGDERPTDSHVTIDRQQNSDPDGRALYHAADRVDVFDEVRRTGQFDVLSTDDRQQTVNDRQLNERNDQHQVVGGRQGLHQTNTSVIEAEHVKVKARYLL